MTIDELIKKGLKDLANNEITEDAIQKVSSSICAQIEDICKDRRIYENKKGKDAHQQFWENFLGAKLLEFYDVKRNPKDGSPDFYFEHNGKIIHIEAKAPEDASKPEFMTQDIPMVDVNMLSQENYKESFQAGLVNPNNAILRFTSILDTTIKKQIKGTFQESGVVKSEDYVILAINGHQVVKNSEPKKSISADPISVGFRIICALKGLTGKEFFNIDTNRAYKEVGHPYKNGSDIKNDYFCKDNDTPIAGVLYSNIGITNILSNNEPFIFIPNPEYEDLRNLFPFAIPVDIVTV